MDLSRLCQRHPGIVGAVDDEQRSAEVVEVGEGRHVVQKLSVVLERAVLALAGLPAPRSRVLEERHEAGDPHDVDARGPQLGLEGEAGQHHVPAVGATPQRRPLGIEVLGSQPRVQRFEVAHGVEALPHIIEVVVALSVTGGAPHIGGGHGVAAVHEVLEHGVELGLVLPLRAAMHHHHDRGRTPSRRRRSVQEDGDRLAVERREAVQLGLREHVGGDGVVHRRQPRGLAGLGVEEPGVPRLTGRHEGVHDEATVV